MIKSLFELDWVINTGKEISFPQSPAKILKVYSGTVLSIPVSFNRSKKCIKGQNFCQMIEYLSFHRSGYLSNDRYMLFEML